MYHYILVRRDLPFGVTLVQTGHAAGDSIRMWSSADLDHDPERLTIVVLGVRDQRNLKRWARKLTRKGIAFTEIREPDAPWNNQLMAIGVWPSSRERLAPIFCKLNLYQRFEGPFTELEDVR